MFDNDEENFFYEKSFWNHGQRCPKPRKTPNANSKTPKTPISKHPSPFSVFSRCRKTPQNRDSKNKARNTHKMAKPRKRLSNKCIFSPLFSNLSWAEYQLLPFFHLDFVYTKFPNSRNPVLQNLEKTPKNGFFGQMSPLYWWLASLKSAHLPKLANLPIWYQNPVIVLRKVSQTFLLSLLHIKFFIKKLFI